jgi:hypothetical protein
MKLIALTKSQLQYKRGQRPPARLVLHKQKRFCFHGSILPPLHTKTGPQKLSEKCQDAPHIPTSTKTFRGIWDPINCHHFFVIIQHAT